MRRRWYVEHGVAIKAVYLRVDYYATNIFTWFVEQVTEARPTGDADKSKALRNSAYGKMIEAVERQTCVIFTKDEKVVDEALRSAYIEDLDELRQAFELESRKPNIKINRPFRIEIVVYQLAKLRMLEFCYDFMGCYFDRRDFKLIQMDTDSNYLAISAGLRITSARSCAPNSSKKEGMAHLGQVERAHAGTIQTQM